MSLPKIPNIPPSLTRDLAINSVLTSIAAGETALSNIVNAEQEKIKYMVEYAQNNDTEEARQKLIDVNLSVAKVLEQVKQIEEILKEKTRLVTQHPIPPVPPVPPLPPRPPKPPIPPGPKPPLPPPPCPPHPPHPKPPFPPVPPHPPTDCSFIYSAKSGHTWHNNCSAWLSTKEKCGNGVELFTDGCQSHLLLSPGKKYKVCVNIQVESEYDSPIRAELLLHCFDYAIQTRKIESGKHGRVLSDTFIVQSGDGLNFLSLFLRSPRNVKIIDGTISVSVL